MLKTKKKASLDFLNKLYLLPFGLLLFLLFITIWKPQRADAHLYVGSSILDHQIPVPGYKKPKCDDIGNPEFHSLRPYQTAHCGDSNKTYFCWNNYNLVESFSTTWDPSTCVDNGGSYSCEANTDIEKIYVIDGEYARWPIMGNTERVTNSQGPK